MVETETTNPSPRYVKEEITAATVDEAIILKTDLGRFGWPILIQVLFYVLRISGEPVACRQVLDLLSKELNQKYILTSRSDATKSINSKIYVERRDRRALYIPIRDQKFPREGRIETTDEGKEGSNGTIPKVETSTSSASIINNETLLLKDILSACRECKGVKHFFANRVAQLVLKILQKNGRRMRRIEILEWLKYLIPRDINLNHSLTRVSNKLVKVGLVRKEVEGRKTYYELADSRSEP